MRFRQVIAISSFILLLGVFSLFIRTYSVMPPMLIDDAYITFRYSSNLADGYGLVYNTDERVLGTTTPGYALVLGVIAAISGNDDIPHIARMTNTLIAILLALFIGLTAYRLTQHVSVGMGTATLTLLLPFTNYANLAGMEVGLFILIVAVGAYLIVSKRWKFAALLFSLSPFVRPEGVFIIGLFGINLLYLYRRGEMALRQMMLNGVVLVFPFLVGLGAMTLYYGSPLPHSIIAKKSGLYEIPMVETIAHVVGYSSKLFNLSVFYNTPLFFVLNMLAYPLMFLGSWKWLRSKDRSLWIIPTLLCCIMLFLATSETLFMPHYYALFEGLVLICWWIGLSYGFERLLHRMGWLEKPLLRMAGFGVIYSFIFLPLVASLPWDAVQTGEYNLSSIEQRMIAYYELTTTLETVMPEDTVIAMPEIGVLGYYLSEIKVLDTAGLVSPEAIPYFPIPAHQKEGANVGAIPVQMVKDYQPPMIITLKIFIQLGLYDDPWFWEVYTPEVQIERDWLPWGKVLYVFVRKDLVSSIDLSPIQQAFQESAKAVRPS